MTAPTEETLNAYVDGELSADERRLVEAHLAVDPDARAFVETLRRVNDLAAEAMAELVPPAPQALIDRINAIPVPPPVQRATEPIAFPVRRARQTTISYYAMAASVVLVAAAALTYVLKVGSPRDALLLAKGNVPLGSAVAELLEGGRSGQSAPVSAPGAATGRAMLAATFQDQAGRYCRELEVSAGATEIPTSASIACRSTEGAWSIEGSVALAGASGDAAPDYVPSGSSNDEPLGPLLQSLGMGKALSTSEEDGVISRKWR
jgi:anti-sigma factor RsiW